MKLLNSTKRIFEPKCVHRHTARTHPKCFKEGKPVIVEEKKPSRVLILDIETLPLVLYSWGNWPEYPSYKNVIKDFCILSWSAKWLYDDKIMSEILTPREARSRDDSRISKLLWNLLDKADVVVAHNGKRFDIRKINTRFFKHGMPQPSSYRLIDTYMAAKNSFGMSFNGQNYIAKFIGSREKLDTEYELWIACDMGEASALDYMREYNEGDVRGLEEIYIRMRSWIPNHPNLTLSENVKDACPVCLSRNYLEIGVFPSKTHRYKEYRCSDCESIWHDSKSIKEAK